MLIYDILNEIDLDTFYSENKKIDYIVLSLTAYKEISMEPSTKNILNWKNNEEPKEILGMPFYIYDIPEKYIINYRRK